MMLEPETVRYLFQRAALDRGACSGFHCFLLPPLLAPVVRHHR